MKLAEQKSKPGGRQKKKVGEKKEEKERDGACARGRTSFESPALACLLGARGQSISIAIPNMTFLFPFLSHLFHLKNLDD